MAYQYEKPKDQRFGQYIDHAGDKLVLSALSNKRAAPYLSGQSVHMPEKLRAAGRIEVGEKMRSVRPYHNAEREKSPEKMQEISMDTGKVEIGCDAQKKKLLVTFVQNERSTEERMVTESSASWRTVTLGSKMQSDDETFTRGAVSLCAPVEQTMPRLTQQFERFSKMRHRDTTLDHVMPFHRVDEEKSRLSKLREQRKQPSTDRTALQTAMTAVQRVIQQKNQRRLRMNAAIREGVTKARIRSHSYDDYIFYLRRRHLYAEKRQENEAEPPAEPQAAFEFEEKQN